MTSTASSKNVLPLSLATLHRIMPRAPAKYLLPLNAAMKTYSINTSARVAAFLSQLAVESVELSHTHEKWTARKNFQLPSVKRPPHTATSEREYFGYWYGNNPKKGNDTTEDGYTYRGRGAIQLTGKKNYIALAKGIHQPLVDNPSLLTA